MKIGTIMMARLSAFLLALVICLSGLAGCGGENSKKTTTVDEDWTANSQNDSSDGRASASADIGDSSDGRASASAGNGDPSDGQASASTGNGDPSDGQASASAGTSADVIATLDRGYLGVWTAYARQVSTTYGWEDVDLKLDKPITLELKEDGGMLFFLYGVEDSAASTIEWTTDGNGFKLIQFGDMDIGRGTLDGKVLTFTYGSEEFSTNYRMVKGGVTEALNMIRDNVDEVAFVGVWEMTEIRDWEGKPLEKNSYNYGDGLILNVKDDGFVEFIDVSALAYSAPKEYAWAVDDGYINFDDFEGIFKDGVLQINLMIGTGYFKPGDLALTLN